MMIHAVPQKVHYHSHWKRNQDAAYWMILSKAQDFGIAIPANTVICDHHNPVPGDWILRVISEKGD